MTDESALLRAILLRPGDDTPRLAYADWLEENADTIRCDRQNQAEFIRDSCLIVARHTDCPRRLEAVQARHPAPIRCGVCDYCQARRRCERHYAKYPWVTGANYAVAFDPTPLDGPMPNCSWLTLIVRRGFVDEISCPLEYVLDTSGRITYEALGLFNSQPITRVRITDRVPGKHREVRQIFSRYTHGNIGPMFGWYSSESDPTRRDLSAIVWSVWARLQRGEQFGAPMSWKSYDSAADAHADLSDAIVSLCREAVGLTQEVTA